MSRIFTKTLKNRVILIYTQVDTTQTLYRMTNRYNLGKVWKQSHGKVFIKKYLYENESKFKVKYYTIV